MTKEIKFNVNNYVKVKLTNYGKRILESQHIELYKKIGIDEKFKLPKTDANGYSKFQLWSLMQHFGPYTGNGFDVPFETEIKILTTGE